MRLEVRRGDGPLPGAQRQRPAGLGLLRRLGVDPAGRGLQVGHRRRRTAAAVRSAVSVPGAHVAVRAAARAVAGDADLGAVLRDRAVLADRRRRGAGSRGRTAPRRCWSPTRRAGRSGRTRRSPAPPATSCVPRRSTTTTCSSSRRAATGVVETRNDCPVTPVERPSSSAGCALGVLGGHGDADRLRARSTRCAATPGTSAGRAAAAAAGRAASARACRRAPAARASAGPGAPPTPALFRPPVPSDSTIGPHPRLAVPGLPGQRRVARVDADALARRRPGRAGARTRRATPCEAEVQGVALGQRRRREADGRLARAAQVVPARRWTQVAAGVRRVRGGQRRRADDGLARGGEHGRVGVVEGRRDLGALRDADHPVGRRRQPEREVGARDRRRERLDAHQVEEVHVQPVRHLVDPVEHHLAHPREQLDQRDARVGHVVVGPLGGEARDQALGLVDDVLEGAVVEVRAGRAASGVLAGDHVEGVDQVAAVVGGADAVGDA